MVNSFCLKTNLNRINCRIMIKQSHNIFMLHQHHFVQTEVQAFQITIKQRLSWKFCSNFYFANYTLFIMFTNIQNIHRNNSWIKKYIGRRVIIAMKIEKKYIFLIKSSYSSTSRQDNRNDIMFLFQYTIKYCMQCQSDHWD